MIGLGRIARRGADTAIAFAEPELNWGSFIVTPPFPDYVSGHSTFSGAAATVLPLFYDTDDLPFTTGSDSLPGVYRSFPTCLAAAEEAAVSRLYGGIHFRFSNEDGLTAGVQIGEWTFINYMRTKGNRSRKAGPSGFGSSSRAQRMSLK